LNKIAMKFTRLWMFCALIGWSALARAQFVAPTALPPDVETRLRAILADPQVRQAHIGVSVKALGTAADVKVFPSQPYLDRSQPILWEQDAQKRFIPASNTKLYTAALALKYLGAQYTFPTRLAVAGKRVGSTLHSSLYIIGGGDPSLTTADLTQLAARLKAAGIRRVEGDIIGDGSAFEAESFGGRYPDGWTLDDTLWYYGMESSALAINRNQVDVTIEATQPGQAARVTVAPADSSFVRAQVETRSRNAQSTNPQPDIHWERAVSGSAIGPILKVSGVIFPGQKVSEGAAVPNPPMWAAQILKRVLQQNGIAVTGVARAKRVNEIALASSSTLATHLSPPLKVLLAGFLKPSDNLYGEMLLRAVSYYATSANAGLRRGTAQASHQMLFDWFRVAGIESEGLRFTDGSGLSRYNMITPRATVQLLAEVEKLPDAEVFWDALPIAGVDGTLRNRMRGTAQNPNFAQGNVHAKTGSFSIVSTLSGYVTTRNGHRLAVSILTNFASGNEARRVQNEICSLLAQSTWTDRIEGNAVN
jgi:D-alanyl-D-alanine carboxypeptidase/D-alanyl-D-alanine-endopeptidase (penicillin-binding protein 4)